MKHLGTLNVLGELVRVLIGSVEEFDDTDMSDDTAAGYSQEDNTIRLNSRWCGSYSQARGNLLHEMVHAWFRISGARHYLRTQMPQFTGEKVDEIEEVLIRAIVPAIDSSLDGLVKMLQVGRRK